MLNEGFTNAYVQSKQAEVDAVTVKMQAALDKLYVDSVNELLIGLGRPTISKKAQIKRILSAYNALSAEQKAQVKYTSLLKTAEKIVEEEEKKQKLIVVGCFVGGFILVGGAALTVLLIGKKKRNKEATE